MIPSSNLTLMQGHPGKKKTAHPAHRSEGAGRNKTVYYIFFGLVVLLGSYFLFSSSSDKDKQKASGEQAALATLFGGGSGVRGRSGRGSSSGDDSLSGSDFWKAGVPDKAITDKDEPAKKADGEPELLDTVSAGNPVNPQTGQPYPDYQMKQFEELGKKFPGNDIIPKRKTAEETKNDEAAKQGAYAAQALVAQGKASPEQVDKFYDFQAKPVRDRLELLEYVMKEQGSSMSPEVREQYEKILQMNKTQLNTLEEARKKGKAGGR